MRLSALALSMRFALSLTVVCGVATASPDALAQASKDPLSVLIDQGKYWQSHHRGDLAEQAWQKVLRIDPKQPDALYGMGMVLADRKDGAGAQQYLARLKAVAPNYPNLDELGRRLGESSLRDQTVNDARRLAQSGQSASAVEEYQRALNGKPATPELQLEYYQALSATPQGWDQARRGLEQLARDNPDDPRYALAYAQHLTYRDTTRRDGIARLQKLTGDSTVGASAKKSWRQALLWLDARPSDAATYEAYLQASPDDAAVKARFDSMVQQDKAARDRAQENAAVDARGRTIADGFAALDRGELDTARSKFSSVLANSPNDTDALGGMGIAALKQERFAEARNYLERASRSGNPARWKTALDSATYWTYTSDAIGARSNGEFAKAKSLFERAIALNPSDVTAQVLLGEMLLSNHDPAGAEQAYRMALRRQADNPDAIRGLVGALAAQGRGDEALQFANQLNSEQQSKAGGINRLRGEAQAAQARAAEARGDLGSARSLFEDALLNNPDDPWLRLDLARIYVRQGAVANARSMMDGLLAAHPDMTDALYASALLSAETQDWAAGLAQLERIPVAQRTDAMTTLQHRLWVHQQADLATRMARNGQSQQALATLQAAEPVAGNNPELIGVIAAAYQQAGDPNRALGLVRSAMNAAPGNTDLLLQYAGILSATRQEAELGMVMRRLASMQLTPQQRTDFGNLNLGIVIKQCDAVRQRGDLASAYDVIAPWLAAMPDNPDLQAALGRLYSSAGDDRNALASYRVALQRKPDDLNLLQAGISAATGAKQFSYAESLARQALAAAPGDPGVLATVGRMYRAEGKLSLASTYLQRSLVAANTPLMANAPRANAPGNVPRGWEVAMRRIGATPLPGTNPFEGKTATISPTDADNAAFAGAGSNAARASLPYSQSSLPSQTVPNYPPPTQPAPYVAPYTAPAPQPYSPNAAPAALPYNAPLPGVNTGVTARGATGLASQARRCNRIRARASRRCNRSRSSSTTRGIRSRLAIRSKAATPNRVVIRNKAVIRSRLSIRSRCRTAMRPRHGRCRLPRVKRKPTPVRCSRRVTRIRPRARNARPARNKARQRAIATRRPMRRRRMGSKLIRSSNSPITASNLMRSSRVTRNNPINRFRRSRLTPSNPISRIRRVRVITRNSSNRTFRSRRPVTRSRITRSNPVRTAMAAATRNRTLPIRRRLAWRRNWLRSIASNRARCRAGLCSATVRARTGCRR